MLNVVLICGGSGGKALQNGFAEIFGYGNYHLDAVINAYDDGKSTGVCRSIFGNKILGPSDLRKNQLTQYKIKYKEELKNKSSKESKLLDLFELRMDGSNYLDYLNKSKELIVGADYLNEEEKNLFICWVNYFFYDNGDYRKGVKEVDYKDFSLSNIFYASCAAMNNYSLEEAGSVIADILKLDKTVHLVSNISLKLSANTESGYHIIDEGGLVSWNNADDKVKEVVLTKPDGTVYIPSVNEENKTDIKEILTKADLIIFSSGTQWSSLIPTYMHKGFNELIKSCKARKYLVMNNADDMDSKGVSADELLEHIFSFMDYEDIKIVINDNAIDILNHCDDKYQQLHGVLSEKNNSKHNPKDVVSLIMKDYYGLDDNDTTLICDLDGTVYDEKMEDKTICLENFKLFKGMILSGNNYKHVFDITNDYYLLKDRNIYCNYGNTFFKLDDGGIQNTLSEEFKISDEIVEELSNLFPGKVSVRGEAILTIKPLDNREYYLKMVNEVLTKHGSLYKAEIAGHTSIDVMKPDFSKGKMFEMIVAKENIDTDTVVYVGDGFKNGNDKSMLDSSIKTVSVKDPYDTYAFLRIYYE